MNTSRRGFLKKIAITGAASLAAGIGIGIIARDEVVESRKIKNYDRKFNEHNLTLNNLIEAVEVLKSQMLSEGLTKVKIGEVLPPTISFLVRFINSAAEKNNFQKFYFVKNDATTYITRDSLDYFKNSIKIIPYPNVKVPPEQKIDRLDIPPYNNMPRHGEREGKRLIPPMV